MDISFIAVSIIFFIFILIAYFLGVIRLSVPLVAIYLVYSFVYLINNEQIEENDVKVINQNKSINLEVENKLDLKTPILLLPKTSSILVKKMDSSLFSKPIISNNPKPIIIDSNIIFNEQFISSLINTDSNNITSIKVLNNKEKVNQNILKLNEIMICRGIYKRNPIKPGSKFMNNIDSLFCYTKISNSGPKQEIKHIWYFHNEEITRVTYNIKTSFNYRSWSKKTINSEQTGDWRVDVVDSNGNILGTQNFIIKSINTSY